MQLKPEMLAQQLHIENRLRYLNINSRPNLQKDDARLEKGKSDTDSTSTSSLASTKSPHLQQSRKLNRQRRPKCKILCPMPANQESNKPPLPIDLLFNTRHQTNRASIQYSHGGVVVKSKAKLPGPFGVEPLNFHTGTSGAKTKVHFPSSGKKSDKCGPKQKWKNNKTVIYEIIFDGDKHIPENSLPSNRQTHAWQEHAQTIPVFVPSLEQEQAMLPKRFSRSTLQSRSPTSSMFNNKIFYAE